MRGATFGKRFIARNVVKISMEALERRLMLTAASGDVLYVKEQPIAVAQGANIGTTGKQFVVEAINRSTGTVDTSFNGTVTVSIDHWNNQQYDISGQLTVNAQNGVATFSNLTFEDATAYTCIFTDSNGDSSLPSADVFVSYAPASETPDELQLYQAPTQNADGTFNIVFAVEDANGNPIANGNTMVSLTIFSGPTGAVLFSTNTGSSVESTPPGSGSSTVHAMVDSNGLATFTNVAVSVSGNYVFQAEASAPNNIVLTGVFAATGQSVPASPPSLPTTPPIVIQPPQSNGNGGTSAETRFAAVPVPQFAPALAFPVEPQVIDGIIGVANADTGVSVLGAASSTSDNWLLSQ